MSITSIQRDLPNNVSLVRITTTDTIDNVQVAGYITAQQPTINHLNNGVWNWNITDMLLMSCSNGIALFQFTDDTFATIVQYPANNSSSNPNNYIYVSNSGSNTTGDGSFDTPFLTVAYALSQITTNSVSNPFTIYLIGGVVVETAQVNFKPFVSVVGLSEGTVWQLNSNTGMDPSWETTASGMMSLSSFSFISGDIILDFSNFSNVTTPVLFVHDIFSAADNFDIKGGIDNDPNIFLTGCLLVGFNFSNCFVQMHACEIVNLTANNGSLDPQLNDNTIFCLACTLQNVTLNGFPFTPNTVGTFYGCRISNGLTGDGATVTILQDVSSYIVPTLINGATADLVSLSNGLSANYTAVNYTPVATPPDIVTSMHAHLRGIDNALAGAVTSWTEVTGTSQAAAVNSGYIANNAGLVTITLPATFPQGKVLTIIGKGAGGWKLQCNTGQTIHTSAAATTAAGAVASGNQWDAISIVCVTANTTFATISYVGTLTYT